MPSRPDSPLPTAILVMGVSGSGKSSVGAALAARLGWSFFDGDDFHSDANRSIMESGVPLTDCDRAPWLAALNAHLKNRSSAGQSSVLACSALKRAYRRRLAEGLNDVCLVFLDGDPELIRRRMSARGGHYMSPEMLQSQLDDLERPTPDEAVVLDIRKPVETLVDEIILKINTSGGDVQPSRPDGER